MDRHGHVGLNLLVFTPIAYVLIQTGRGVLVVPGLLGLMLIEPLVDLDRVIPWTSHRGTSHTVVGALVVGVLCGVGVYLVLGFLVTTLTELAFGQPVIVSGASEQSLFNLTRNAQTGFVIGAGSVLLHIFGDSLTEPGVQPLYPVSRARLSFDLVSREGWSQFTLLAVGLLAFGGMVLLA